MWGNRKEEELPESLRGKTPEQIAQALADAQKDKERVDRLEVQLKESNTKFESFATTQQSLVDTLKAVNERMQPAAPRVDPNANNEPASFITDPDLAFNQRISPLASITMQTAAITAKTEARRGFERKQATEKNNIDASLFDRFEGEILEMAKTCSPAQLANPATWAHLFFNVKGRHTDEIVSNPKSFFVEDSTRQAASNGTPAEDTLTDQEKSIASKMGVSPENYLKNKKASTAMPF